MQYENHMQTSVSFDRKQTYISSDRKKTSVSSDRKQTSVSFETFDRQQSSISSDSQQTFVSFEMSDRKQTSVSSERDQTFVSFHTFDRKQTSVSLDRKRAHTHRCDLNEVQHIDHITPDIIKKMARTFATGVAAFLRALKMTRSDDSLLMIRVILHTRITRRAGTPKACTRQKT